MKHCLIGVNSMTTGSTRMSRTPAQVRIDTLPPPVLMRQAANKAFKLNFSMPSSAPIYRWEWPPCLPASPRIMYVSSATLTSIPT